MKFKWSALLLTLGFLLSLVACNGDAKKPASTTASTTDAQTTAQATTVQSTTDAQETTAQSTTDTTGTPQVPPVPTEYEVDLSDGLPAFMAYETTGSDTSVSVNTQGEVPYISLRDGTENGRASVWMQFEPVTDVITVSYRVRFTALSVYTLNLIPNAASPSTPLAQIVARPSGAICVFNGSAETQLGTYTVNEWIDITVHSYLKTGDFAVSLGRGEDTGGLFHFRNEGTSASCYIWNTLHNEVGGMDIACITVDPFLPPPDRNIPTVEIGRVNKTLLVSSDDVKDGMNYLSFPTTALTETEVWIAYKRGYSHTSDNSNLDVTVLDRATNRVITTHTVDSSTEVRFQNPEFVTMPNGEILLYVDIQEKGTSTRLGIYTYQFHVSGGNFSKRTATSLIDDKGIAYGYIFDSVIDGNTLYMLAMTFPELQNQGNGRSVHLLKTDDNGTTFTHVANLTELLGVGINESGMVLKDGVLAILARGDSTGSHLFRVTTDGKLLGSRHLSGEYDGVSYTGRPDVFCENGTYFFMGRNIPTSDSNAQELAIFEFDFETLRIQNKRVLDTRTGSAGDAYYAERFISEIDGQKIFCVVNYGTSFSQKPSIELLTFPCDRMILDGQ